MAGIIQFETDLGTSVIIRRVEVYPKDKAIIRCLYVDNGVETHKLILEGEHYKAWGNDDEYLGHFCISQLTNGKVKLVGSDYVPIVTPVPAPAPATYDDTRSVHNDADIARIQTLQEQLDAQALKLKTITDLLFKNGSI